MRVFDLMRDPEEKGDDDIREGLNTPTYCTSSFYVSPTFLIRSSADLEISAYKPGVDIL